MLCSTGNAKQDQTNIAMKSVGGPLLFSRNILLGGLQIALNWYI